MLAMARIVGDLDLSKQKYGWYRGVAMGFRPGEAGRDLFGVMGMGAGRLIPFKDKPGFTNVRRECGYYFDLKTGEVIDTWVNPYTDEKVEVLHIANPQINAPIEPVLRGANCTMILLRQKKQRRHTYLIGKWLATCCSPSVILTSTRRIP